MSDVKDRDIRLARIVESEHGKFLISEIERWIGEILKNFDKSKAEEDERIVGAYLNMKQFLFHVENAPARLRGEAEIEKALATLEGLGTEQTI
jgi:hypothetical protein